MPSISNCFDTLGFLRRAWRPRCQDRNRVDQKRKKGTPEKIFYLFIIKTYLIVKYYHYFTCNEKKNNHLLLRDSPSSVKTDNITEIYTVTAALIFPSHLSALVAATGSPTFLLGICLDSTVNTSIHSIAGCHHEIMLSSQKTCMA